MIFVQRDPNKGYYGRQLWLPKDHINTRAVKAGLEFPILDSEGLKYLQLWEDAGHHLVVPREFLSLEDLEQVDFPVISTLPAPPPRIEFGSRIVLDAVEPTKNTQRNAAAAMLHSRGGLLNLACVAGDTVLNLNRGGKGFKIKISAAHRRFHGAAERYNWDHTIPTFIRSLTGESVGLNDVCNIIYRGKRVTYTLVLTDGKTLRATGDHEILTVRGWVQLRHLTVGDLVIVDGKRDVSVRQQKKPYRRLSWYASHPYARKQIRRGRKTPSYQIEEHRAVAEASMNGLTLEEFRDRCRRGDVYGLQFIDPNKYHVHHMDEDIYNNAPDNLEVLVGREHLARHQPGYVAFGDGVPIPTPVACIKRGKLEDVYDVICGSPHHNFVANGIVVHNCGKGKTVLALHLVANRKVPALVIVNNTTLINQWRDRINAFLDVPGGIGLVQGPPENWDWEGRGIVLSMIHSLGLRHDQLPQGFDRRFGLIIYDEVHHVSAPLFLPTAPLFYGERHGLTATTSREDGLEAMYQYHIGRTYFRDLTQDLKPRVYFQACPFHPNMNEAAVREAVTDKAGRLSIPRLRNYIGTNTECNEFIASKLRKPLDAGRKLLVLSHSVDQLRLLNEMFADSGLCTGREKPEDRLVTLRTKRLSFGTLQLVKEALDEDTLDTLFFLTPFGSSAIEEGGFNTLQQGMGRIQRYREGKKTPVVVILDYVYVPKMHRMCTTLKKQLRNWPADQGGPLEYSVLRPYAEEKKENE